MHRLFLTLLPLTFALAVRAQETPKPTPAPAPAAAKGSPKKLIAPNHSVLPTGQILSPAGVQGLLPGVRPQILALSPDGNLLITAGNTKKLIALHPETGVITQEVNFPPDAGKPSG